jgi:DNA-binding sugar fermentation-stimulating protein
MNLYIIKNPVKGVVLKRPSLYCKTPYVADVQIENEEIMGHSPSLGCCGLADKGANVILSKLSTGKTKTSHRIELSIQNEEEYTTIVGINPKLGESIAENALNWNCIKDLTNIRSYRRETTILNSRFDFTGIDSNGRTFVMEVKNVPLADYVDVPKKERKQYLKKIENMKYNEKIAYFPDGYRKNSTDVVSPRALKHIEELEQIAQTSHTRAILCFIVQRSDANCFQPSNIDLTYKKAVQKAWLNGVEIKTIQVEWSMDGICKFIRNDLPIYLFDYEGPHLLSSV